MTNTIEHVTALVAEEAAAAQRLGELAALEHQPRVRAAIKTAAVAMRSQLTADRRWLEDLKAQAERKAAR